MVILGVFGVIVLAGIIYLIMFLVSRLKASIKIDLEKMEFSQGETIRGKAIIKIKKPIEKATLKAGILGRLRSSHMGRASYRSSNRKFFEFYKPIGKEKNYPIGEIVIPLEVKIPSDILGSSQMKGTLGNVMKTAQLLTFGLNSVYWYVKVFLDVPGVDISKKVRINIV